MPNETHNLVPKGVTGSIPASASKVETLFRMFRITDKPFKMETEYSYYYL